MLGAGTPYVCEDIEMATRASLGGFVGAVIPDLVVRHDHRRGRDSVEARRVLASYARGRGAYHAKLLAQEVDQAWLMWRRRFMGPRGGTARDLDRLATEFEGAAAYLRQRIASGGR